MRKSAKCISRALILLIILIVCKDQFEKNLMANANYGMPSLISKGEVENLFIGSSMFRQGIDIEVLNESSDSNYILAYNGNQPALEKWILEYLLDNGVIIDNLYLDMYVYSAFEKPELSDEKILMEVGLKGKGEIWNIYSSECGYGLEDWWRFYVSGNNELLLTWFVHNKIVNTRFVDGGRINYSSGISVENASNMSVPKVEGNINEIQERAIIDIISICKDNGINVTFIETPKYKSIMEDESYQSAIEEYASLLDMYSAEYILSEDLEGQDISADSYNFIDMIHLSTKGMKEYTKRLVEKIN